MSSVFTGRRPPPLTIDSARLLRLIDIEARHPEDRLRRRGLRMRIDHRDLRLDVREVVPVRFNV